MKRGILVVRGGAIGDFVLTLPAIHLLRDAFPDSPLHVVGYRSIVALAENRFYAHGARSIEYAPMARFFVPGADLPEDLVDFFGSFAQVVSYLFDPDGIFGENLRRCGVKYLLAASPRIEAGSHAAAQLARPLEELSLFLDSPSARLYPSPEDFLAASDWMASGRPLVALHPGSGSPHKNLPFSTWLEVVSALEQHSAKLDFLVVGGEADGDVPYRLAAALPSGCCRLAESLPLPLLAAIFSKCALYLGHDTGISHIAAAAGVPCLLAYGATDPMVWAPRNPGVRVFDSAGQGMDRIAAADLIAAALESLDTLNRT